MVEKGPVTRGLASRTRALAMVAVIHYLWLSFGSSLHARVVSEITPDIFRGVTRVEDGSVPRPAQSLGRGTTEETAP